MIKIQWRCVLLLGLSASAVHAQQWPAYYANPYYQQAPAPRYYNPNSNGNYPSYATPGAASYGPPAIYYPASQGNNSPAFTPSRQGGNYPYSAPSRFPYSAAPSGASSQGGEYPYQVQPGFPESSPPGTTPTIVPSPVNERYYPNQAVISQGRTSPATPADDRQYVLSVLGQRVVNAVDPSGALRDATYHRAPNETIWIAADYLGSFARPMRVAGPLLTTGSINDAHPGAIGQPSTAVLFGNRDIDFNLMSGASLNAGVFLDTQNRFSLEWRGFLSAQSRNTFSIESDANGNPLLTRPVFATDLGDQRVFLTAFPDQFAGRFSVETKSQFGGTEFNAGYHSYNFRRLHAEALVGFRYMRLAESMQIQDNVTGLNGFAAVFPPAGGATFNSYSDQDNFATTNQFFGGQIGSRLTWEYDWLTLGVFTKLGLGATVQHVDINGSTTFLSPAGNQTVTGGVLAQSSNIGSYSRSVFGIVPELGLDIGINVCNHVRLHLGYSALLWNRVVRPGGQIDTNVNTALAPTGNFGAANVTGPIAPLFRFNDEPYWLQSFKLGVELRY